MKQLKNIITATFFLFTLANLSVAAQTKYRCQIQMDTYKGEPAYVVVSLISPDGKYDKTLRVLGPNKRWYNSLKEWYKAQKSKPEKLDAITSASIKGGDRTVTILEIDDKKINKGYKIRFESSVEDQNYYADDVEIPYTTDKLTSRTNGKGYIKTVRITKVETKK